MRITIRMHTALFALLSALTVAVPLHSQTTYRVFNLGTIGGTSSAGNGINDISWVTGTSTIDSSESSESVIHATLWAYGLKLDLGTLGGPNSGVLWPNENNFGLISGVAETAEIDKLGEAWSCSAFFPSVTYHVCRGFVWKWGKMTKLPTFGGTNGFATGNNNLGQTVGWAENTTHDPTCVSPQVLQFEAAEWDAITNKIHELPPLLGDPDSAATAINDEGQAVGISGICYAAVGASTAEHMILWEHYVPTSLPTLGGNDWNTPMAVNDRGQVVGFSDLPSDSPTAPNFHAFYWSRETGTIDIGTLSGDVYSEALGINNVGQVVGESCSAGFAICRAFIWQNGTITDLNMLISSGPTLDLLFANDINDSGQITGGAIDASNNTAPAFLAIPERNANPARAQGQAALPATPLPVQVREALARRNGLKLLQLK